MSKYVTWEELISIHAPLARCDEAVETISSEDGDFNPRTSCEVRLLLPMIRELLRLFQSTHLLRGATRLTRMVLKMGSFQSTHLLRGATYAERVRTTRCTISIHAPLARCDTGESREDQNKAISIHAPLARCDPPPGAAGLWITFHFNPRTSCEVRPP